MGLIISFAALFLSVILLQLGAGTLAPLDALAGLAQGFTRTEVGFLGSAHFVGFFIGCWFAPRLMGAVGHSRAFSAFVAVGTIGILSHTIFVHPLAWAAMRVLGGFCVAGAFTIIESWLQAKVTNATRGRTMGTYRIVDIGGQFLAQMMIGVLDPVSYVSYNLLALCCCAALIPLTLTRVTQPAIADAPRLRPSLAWNISPLATLGVVVSGLTAASFRMVGPVYGVEVALDADQLALFLSAWVLGGAASQYPVGWLADRFDRRWVLIWLSVAGIFTCALMAAASGMGAVAIVAASAVFGATTIPIYSVSAAHAHDFAESEQRVELSAALLFFYAIGAIAAPYGASWLIENLGPASMFAMISIGHAALIGYGIVRMRRRPTATRTKYVYAPRTSFLIGRLLKPAREQDPAPKDPTEKPRD